MPDTFGLSNEPLAPQRWSIPEKELNADFAQSVVTRKARADGLPMGDAILEGIKGRQTATDPFYALKVMEFQSRIADHAAEAANRIRVLKMKEAETLAEQQDQTELMNIALRFKGKPKEALDAIGSFSPRSQLGVRAASEQRLAIVGLTDHDQEAKNIASLSYADRRAYKLALAQAGGTPNAETDAILDAGLAKAAQAKASAATQLGRDRLAFEMNKPFHVGDALYQLDDNGDPVQIVAPPDKPIRFNISKDLLGKDKTVLLTPQAFAEQISTLPVYARTNTANLAQLRAAGFGPDGKKLNSPATTPSTATQIPDAAKAYLRANPSLKSAFEAKYGKGSADGILSE